jgi:hypothetical protein
MKVPVTSFTELVLGTALTHSYILYGTKSVLVHKGIISQNGKGGKRGIRVYPPWDNVMNKQAEKTQSWQTKYFVTIKRDNSNDFDLTRKLFNETSKTDNEKNNEPPTSVWQ